VEVVSEIVNETALPQLNQYSTYFCSEDENLGKKEEIENYFSGLQSYGC